MIHVITVHYPHDRWVPIQIRQLRATLRDFVTYAVVPKQNWPRKLFDVELPDQGGDTGHESDRHAANLFALAGVMTKGFQIPNDDIFMCLDGDAFPVVPLDDILEKWLENYPVVSIEKSDRAHKPGHHARVVWPAFLACRMGFFKRHLKPQGWGRGTLTGCRDTCGRMTEYLIDNDIQWLTLRRSNSEESEIYYPYFGVYGRAIYHHGIGFRDPPLKPKDKTIAARQGRLAALYLKRIQATKTRLRDEVFSWIDRDPLFYKRFL